MAIDDNTIYGLYGSQIKDLPEKINAVKGQPRFLTASDYNYPVSNPASVNPGMLAPGFYIAKDGTVNVFDGQTARANRENILFFISKAPSETNMHEMIVIDGNRGASNESYKVAFFYTDTSTGTTSKRGGALGYGLLDGGFVVNNLDSNASNRVLSAKQGKVLKDFIGDLTNLTTTDKTNLVAAINEAAAGGGGGGIIELTSADYNYPTDNPSQIAAWLLPDGIYHSASTAIQWSAYGDSANSGTFIKTTNSSNMAFVFFYRESGLNEVILSQALGSTHYTNLLTSAVKQSTGTSTTDVMSQNAVTSMVFADPSTKEKVNIGGSGVGVNGVTIGRGAYGGDNTSGSGTVAIGLSANTYGGTNAVAIGNAARARAEASISIGLSAGHPTTDTQYKGAISLGAYSEAHAVGEMNIGSSETVYGYNSSNYRLLTGLYDPQSAHDAATKGYVDPTTDSSAPTSATVGRLGQIQIDTTNADAYMCVAVDSVTPSYTWKKITV